VKRNKFLAIAGVVTLFVLSVLAVGFVSYFRGVEIPSKPLDAAKPALANELQVGDQIVGRPREE